MTIATGLWWDYSKSGATAATLTLSARSGGFLLSFLAFLVTVAGTSTWSIAAFCIHSLKSNQKKSPHPLDFMHRVTLRNSGTGISTFWKIIKNHRDWASTTNSSPHAPPPRKLATSSALVAIPALLVWIGFAIAAIFTSNVANKAYKTTFARLQDDHCGLWRYDTTTTQGDELQKNRDVNDTLNARNYAENFYVNPSNPSKNSRSLFVQQALPYSVDNNVTCPWGANKCLRRENGTMRAYTSLLDSHSMLGINAKPRDRLGLQINMTCSPITTLGYVEDVAAYDNASFTGYFYGPVRSGDRNATYLHFDQSRRTGMGYLIRNHWALAGSQELSTWLPVPEFNRSDADVSIYFLSQNAVTYQRPVLDPMFAATGRVNFTDPDGKIVLFGDYLVTVMVCTEQYTICNPFNSLCTPPRGRLGLHSMVLSRNNDMDLTLAQAMTASRLLLGLINNNSFNIIKNIGVGALWANSKLMLNTMSPHLPANQWQIEALGWFQTALAGLQGWITSYPANDIWRSPHADPDKPYGGELARVNAEACQNQLVRTSGEVQNFDFLAVVFIVVICILLILIDLILESVVDLICCWRGWGSISRQARQTDNQLHLLHAVLSAEDSDENDARDQYDGNNRDMVMISGTAGAVAVVMPVNNHNDKIQTIPTTTTTEVNTDSSDK